MPEHIAGDKVSEASKGAGLQVSRILGYIVRADLQDSPLGRFANLVASDMLRQGVTLSSSPNVKAGIKVRLTDKGIDLDLSDNAIADLLMQHLQPRFRALLEGIV